MTTRGKSVLVLGLGESGLAMAQWLDRQGAAVRVADSRSEPPFAAELRRSTPRAVLVSGAFRPALLDGIDILGLSPGLALDEPLVVEARARGISVVGEIELFARALRDIGLRPRCRVVAITGTNGKTTTTALLGEMCRAAGRVTALAGNIGPAALSALMTCLDARQGKDRSDVGKLPEIWVLELSSFQLETTESLDADAAVVLNVSEDHLDRYAGLADYAAAKARIFAGAGVQVLNREDPRVMAMARSGRLIRTFGLDAPAGESDFGLVDGSLAAGEQALLRLDQLAMSGRHNAANALAALAAYRALALPLQPALDVLQRFRGLPHRVEKIAEIDAVLYYDDSKGTNVGATVAAIEGLGRKVVLIAGGDGKGQDFTPLGPALAQHGRALVLIGRDATRIESAVAGCGVSALHAQDMEQAVRKAAVAARPGDAVLLSPACASFDMFRNYEHRAEVFANAVRRLALARQGEAS